MKINVLSPFANPSTNAPTMKPIDMPKTRNSVTFVHFYSNRPSKSNFIPRKNHTPHKFNFSIVTNRGASKLNI